MSPPDDIDEKLSKLAARTAGVRAPPGFEARMLAKLAVVEAREQRRFWRVGTGAVGLALCSAIASVALAVWHDERLTDELSRSPDFGVDVDARDP